MLRSTFVSFSDSRDDATVHRPCCLFFDWLEGGGVRSVLCGRLKGHVLRKKKRGELGIPCTVRTHYTWGGEGGSTD